MNQDSLYEQILSRLNDLDEHVVGNGQFAELRGLVDTTRQAATSAHARIDDLERSFREALARALEARTPVAAPAKKWYESPPWNRLIYVGVLVGILILSQLKLIDLMALDVWWDRVTSVEVGVRGATDP